MAAAMLAGERAPGLALQGTAEMRARIASSLIDTTFRFATFDR
jgi:hypothetical protein